MTTIAISSFRKTGIRLDLGARLEHALDRLADWAERRIPEGEDGLRIPRNVRRIIAQRNFYV